MTRIYLFDSMLFGRTLYSSSTSQTAATTLTTTSTVAYIPSVATHPESAMEIEITDHRRRKSSCTIMESLMEETEHEHVR